MLSGSHSEGDRQEMANFSASSLNQETSNHEISPLSHLKKSLLK